MKIDIQEILKEIHVGDDGKVSGKRAWGSSFFGASIIMGFVALFIYPNRFDTFALFVSPFIMAGLTCWGLATWQTQNNRSLDVQATNPTPTDTSVKIANVEQVNVSSDNQNKT